MAAIKAAHEALTRATPAQSGVVTPARDWEGEGEILHRFEAVLVRNTHNRVYLRFAHNGKLVPWEELTRGG